MRKPIAICFAGAVGCGKTPIANHLSWSLGLPRYERDAIRSEARETLATSGDSKKWITLFDKLAAERQRELLGKKQDIILDASIDRTWEGSARTKSLLEEYGYDYILISFDLSVEFLRNLYAAKGYTEFAALERTYDDHNTFTSEHSEDVGVIINEDNYLDRLSVCHKFVEAVLISEATSS